MGSSRMEAGATYHILLLARNPEDVRLLTTMLDSVRSVVSFITTRCESLEAALAVQQRQPQDAVLLDLALPGDGGLEGLERLRKACPHLPVILLAESPADCTPTLAAQRGAQDLLLKHHLDAYLLVRALRYAAERRRSREALRRRSDKFAQFQSVLLDLTKRDDSDWEQTLRWLTEASASTLGVERAGIWLFDEARRAVVCECLHVHSKGTFEKGLRLQASEYPRYFEALNEHRVVAASDARKDERTSEFTEGYLKPHGITSMLDAPIRIHGRLVGVICHEQVGPPRAWPLEEQDFASSIADLAALALEAVKQRSTEQSLLEERDLLRGVLDSTTMLVVTLDPAGRILRSNSAFRHLTGYGAEEAAARPFWDLVCSPEDRDAVREILANPPSEATAGQHEHAWVTRHGTRPLVAWSLRPLGSGGAGATRSVITGLDVTERKALEEQLVHDAFHDALTGLPNRSLFLDRLGQSLRQSLRRKDRRFGVLFLDMDRFKLINDSLGHMVGDQFLSEIARRIERCVRPGDTVARFGGDEFTLLLDDLQGSSDVAQVAERIHQQLKTPITVAGQEIFTTASIGIALSDTGYERPEDMLRDADIAMYRAKARGGASHEVFDRSMHSRAVSLLRTENELRRALERGEFEVHYQPIVTLKDGRVTGFEALLRWNHPERGRVFPGDFIGTAEETGLIVELDRWVLFQACRQLVEWRRDYPSAKNLTTSVNLSVRQFSRGDLVDVVKATLRETKLPDEALCLEITESVLLEGSPRASEILEGLKNGGARLHLDDFGTGYSSLSYLHRFPVDALKIDRSFVGAMRPDGGGQEIVRAIVALAQNLDLHVIAEGIETAQQRAALRNLQCEYGQGYMFSKPVPADQAGALLASGALLGA